MGHSLPFVTPVGSERRMTWAVWVCFQQYCVPYEVIHKNAKPVGGDKVDVSVENHHHFGFDHLEEAHHFWVKLSRLSRYRSVVAEGRQ